MATQNRKLNKLPPEKGLIYDNLIVAIPITT